jgi:hypothetical protein
MSAREQLAETLKSPGLVGLSEDEANELIDALLQEHTARLFAPIWEMAVEYIRNHPAPGEEPTP